MPTMLKPTEKVSVVEIGAFLTLFYLVQAALVKSESQVSIGYFVALDIWLFLTVLFANFAASLAEERGNAQADSLRKTRRDTIAYRLTSRDMTHGSYVDACLGVSQARSSSTCWKSIWNSASDMGFRNSLYSNDVSPSNNSVSFTR